MLKLAVILFSSRKTRSLDCNTIWRSI